MKNSTQNSFFIVLIFICAFSWYFYRPQIIAFWNSYTKNSNEFSADFWNKNENLSINFLNNSNEFSANSWTAYSSIFKNVSFPAMKLPSFALNFPSLNYSFPSYQFQKFTLPSINLPTFKLPTFSLPSFALNFPSLNYSFPSYQFQKFTLPSINLPTFKLPTINLFSVAKQPVQETIKTTKDCGTSAALNLDDPSTFENNSTLACLGTSAVNCENARGVIKDNLFPTIFEISQSQNSCDFKLSYPADSTLTDVTGEKLAGQYISCPVYIVKAIDNANPAAPRFISPDKADFSKYGSEIYFYGTLGVFIENNLDKNKMEASGCGGSYIDSMIAGYNLSHPK